MEDAQISIKVAEKWYARQFTQFRNCKDRVYRKVHKTYTRVHGVDDNGLRRSRLKTLRTHSRYLKCKQSL